MFLSASTNSVPPFLKLPCNANFDRRITFFFGETRYEMKGVLHSPFKARRSSVEMNVKACRQPHLKVFAGEANRKSKSKWKLLLFLYPPRANLQESMNMFEYMNVYVKFEELFTNGITGKSA
ncbi:hypothetical protein AVEN_92927-1 [Araneus ventricosus]|uniref:Uncharacterized protein n=1 Tax=Araneus ventricosus TaxID=182803 RepID=A0A4Y2D1V7_ARAVE|nr:hypothetical protein AVEN_92927-1 [Araneus ventricosus]